MYLFGFHIPFTSTAKRIRNERPYLNTPVEAVILYQQDNYLTEITIDAVLKNDNYNYYWEGINGITKGMQFIVSPTDKWKYVNNI